MKNAKKGNIYKTCEWIFKYFQPPVPFVWTNVKFRQTSLENHMNFHMTPSPHTLPPLCFKNIGMFLEFLNQDPPLE